MTIVAPTNLIYRKPHTLAAEKDPKPISMVGGGRGGALIAFTQSQEAGR